MPKLLLCRPDHYGIEYEINPWMRRGQPANLRLARTQWQQLLETLEHLGAEVELIPPQPKLPDMVFTANAGLVVDRHFFRSNFRHAERRAEGDHFARWFTQHGYTVEKLPEGLYFEGEGDALFCGNTLVCGYRFRSDVQSHQRLAEFFECLAVSVELVDARFYHLDTCFCALPEGGAFWFPPAFDKYARQAIRQHFAPLIEVAADEALHFACNAIVLGRDIVLPAGCPRLAADLTARGLRCHALPMSEFIKAGGACKCLTLFLPQR